MFKDHVFLLYEAGGAKTMAHKGLCAINDGGYHNWLHTISGWKPRDAPDLTRSRAGARMESIRKDAECTYGIMKKRHRILKVPSLRHNIMSLDIIARCCGVLHNMLMAYDGLDKLGDEDDHWEVVKDIKQLHGLDIDVEGYSDEMLLSDIRAEDKRVLLSAVDQLLRAPTNSVVTEFTDRGIVGNFSSEEEAPEVHKGYFDKVKAMAVHMMAQYEKGELMWLKKAKSCLEPPPGEWMPGSLERGEL